MSSPVAGGRQGPVEAVVPPARTALVTGASRGIGRAVAVGLARAGLDVALLARDADRLAEVAAEVRGLGRRAVVLAADVTDGGAVTAAVAAAETELGAIDLLVNNAGRIDTEVPLWEADPTEWWDVVETNVRGPFLLAHAVVPGMLNRGGGRVVDLNSGAGTRDTPDATAYNVSKTALFRIGGSLHEAGHARGLRTFEVAPGVVVTDMTRSMRAHTARTEWTDVADVVELVVVIARGGLDDLSGRYVRAGTDTPASLRFRGSLGELGPDTRRLRVRDWPSGRTGQNGT
ncbi:SDR family oxidoreductase [Georgenia yuyongxinii]|uniref:SDR family NAD(P)-dependent oxidoreductase n=1 Tax=Georgenia yuyongxinii TaxID=2589797 RepID=A0A552WM49_9MICO|nr:SDR family NAD(P)-dependent oxidoreductase [Georgenia yuyongxinii]TRW43754.1 SDR family NAD(P)-dependent oxidoreductase [Georgenia yuyongxinii]